MTNDDEREARKWLNDAVAHPTPLHIEKKHRATILRLLDRPVLTKGKDVPHNVLRAMVDADSSCDDIYVGMRRAIDVLHAHLTAPPPAKKVEAWALAYPNGGVSIILDKDDPEVRHEKEKYNCRIIKLVEAADE